jgi:phosphate transport system substrate-binding protein
LVQPILLAAAALHLASPGQLSELAQRWPEAYGAGPSAGAELSLAIAPPATEKIFCLPVAVDATAVVYNLTVAGDLRLTPGLLADILEGKAKRWRDPLVEKVNPGVVLPDLPIRLVLVRTPDPDLANYAGATAQAGERVASEEQVAEIVARNEGAIGVLGAARARRTSLFLAALENHDGAFVTPAAHSVSRAAVGVKLSADLRASLLGARGVDSYPMATLVHACSPKDGLRKAADFFDWALRDGQKLVTPLGYAPLPGFLLLMAKDLLKTTPH